MQRWCLLVVGGTGTSASSEKSWAKWCLKKEESAEQTGREFPIQSVYHMTVGPENEAGEKEEGQIMEGAED